LSTSLYVSNLPASATAETLTGTFGQFGTVLSVKLKRDPATGRPCNYGFVEMRTSDEARSAVAGLNATRLDGRLVSVSRAARG
jgi:RNA recognition motif-containing protein